MRNAVNAMSETPFDPYRPPQASLEREASDAPLVLAGRGVRLVAKQLDLVFNVLFQSPIWWSVGIWDRIWEGTPGLTASDLLVIGAGSFVGFFIIQTYPMHRWGQSWGKRLLRIRIVDLDGGKPALFQLLFHRFAIIAALSKAPNLGVLLSFFDALLIFRQDRRCLHDLIAGTQVVKGNPKPPSAS